MNQPATPKGENAAAAILDAAEQLFLEKGFHGTGMREIARAADYKSVAGIYNHFSDKEAIFKALIEARAPYQEAISLIETIEGQTIEVFLPNLFATITQLMQKHARFIKLIMIDYLEFDAVHVRELVQQLFANLSHLIERVQALEGVRQDLPPYLLMRFLGIQIYGYVITRTLMPPPMLNLMPEDEWKQRLVQLLLQGIHQENQL